MKLAESSGEVGNPPATLKNVAVESMGYTSFGQQGRIEFAVTIGMAKELAMVERNEQGKKARLYFIECEKRLTEIAPASSLPSYPEALRKLADTLDRNAKQAVQIAQQTTLIETQKPAVEFVEKYVEAEDLKTFRMVAKLLGANEREFRNFLVDRGYHVRQSGQWHYAARFGPRGSKLFDVKTLVKDGLTFEQTRFTAKGVVEISKKWAERTPLLRKPLTAPKEVACA
jgi:anti-repressor protein